jgi:hypothetical protein
MPIGKVGTRFQFRLRIGDQSAAEGDGGEHGGGGGGDDCDAVAREAILEVAAEPGRRGRDRGEDRINRRLNGRSRGGEIHCDGDGDIDVVRRLWSVGTPAGKG